MTPELPLPGWLEGSAVGVLILIALVVIRVLVTGLSARAKAEASLDQRATVAVDNLIKGFEQEREAMRTALAAEREYTTKLLEMLAAKQQQFDALMRNLVTAHAQDMDTLRSQHAESLRGVHQRVDDAMRDHAECRRDLAELRRRIEALQPGAMAA